MVACRQQQGQRWSAGFNRRRTLCTGGGKPCAHLSRVGLAGANGVSDNDRADALRDSQGGAKEGGFRACAAASRPVWWGASGNAPCLACSACACPFPLPAFLPAPAPPRPQQPAQWTQRSWGQAGGREAGAGGGQARRLRSNTRPALWHPPHLVMPPGAARPCAHARPAPAADPVRHHLLSPPACPRRPQCAPLQYRRSRTSPPSQPTCPPGPDLCVPPPQCAPCGTADPVRHHLLGLLLAAGPADRGPAGPRAQVRARAAGRWAACSTCACNHGWHALSLLPNQAAIPAPLPRAPPRAASSAATPTPSPPS